MHTTEQARELWCPMARVAQVGASEMSAAYNRVLSKLHVPVKLSNPDVEGETIDVTMLKTETQISGAARCIGDKCAMWRWKTTGSHEQDCAITGTKLGDPVTPMGYCGLAGAPTVAP